MAEPEITIVTETFNVQEGQGMEAAREALHYLTRLARERGGIEIILADPMEPNLLVATLLERFPEVKHLSVPGAGYDGIKNLAARQAKGLYVVYLDSDCRPLDDQWLDRLLAPLRAGKAKAAAGITYYYGTGLWTRVQSMLDFGFLIGHEHPIVGCYASNNCAFERQLRVAFEAPDGPMRCTCFAHTQALIRAGKPMLRVPEAVCRHKLPPFWKERFRRGFDSVAACWVDAQLPERRWLRYGVLAAPLFIGKALRTDWRHLEHGRQLWGWSRWHVALARGLAVMSRTADLGGAIRALVWGPDKRWSAYGSLASRETGANLAKAQDSA